MPKASHRGGIRKRQATPLDALLGLAVVAGIVLLIVGIAFYAVSLGRS